ncbi:MAG: ATP-dependent Clp protease ATP-binding subunit [Firmicutes bacterium]|nr:ATP-dependent Clp protease ATP-binding subunit [Bacillota bacterium]
MYNSFTEEARKILIAAKEEMKKLKHPYVGSEHLLLSILKDKNEISEKLKEYNLDYKKFKDELIDIVGIGSKESECFLYTPLLKRIMENALYDSKENNNGNVTISHLFSSMLEEGEGIAIRILIGMDIDLDDLYHEFAYKLPIKKNKNKKLLIDELGVDLTKKAKEGLLDPVVGRDEEINRVIEILSRRKKNNPVLIGEAGVGKTAIVEELSRMISNNEVPNNLKNKRIISLDMATTVAGTKYRGEFEERVNKILKELEENDDIILFIDEIHTLVGAGGAEGAIDASNIFKPALARNKMRCIGATTTNEYKKFISGDKALDRRFQKVEVTIPDKKTVKEILLKLRDTYSNFHKTLISDEIIDYIIELSDKYIKNRYQPDKSIDILDEVSAHVSLKENKKLKKYNVLTKELNELIKIKKNYLIKKDYESASNYKEKENKLMTKINKLELELTKEKTNIVTKEDVIKIVSRKSNVPIFELKDLDKNDIISFEKNLKKNIIGNDKNIDELIKIYKKLKLGFKDDNMCYSMLFVGPSGVGKTQLAKIFSEKVSNSVIRIDMSEYSESHTISKLIGSPAGYVGYDDNKNILERVKDNPFSVLILDEIEKAHSNIINLFYQILDEGKLKDSKGEDIYFNNCMIIMTSNIGFNNNSIGFNNKNKVNNELKESFSIPFINRIDNILPFEYLTHDNIKDIINNKIKKLKNKYKKKGINVKINSNVIEEVIENSNYKDFGARKIDKIIKNEIEMIIINEILDNKDVVNIKTIKKEVLN